MTPANSAAPLSRPLRIETLKLRSTEITVTPTAAEREALSALMGLASIESLEARYAVTRNGDRVSLRGDIVADLHQICVVTLDPFPVRVRAPVALEFTPEELLAGPRREEEAGEIDIELSLAEEDPPEPIIDGVIDLGTVTAEFLALALDPYPRKPGVAFDSAQASDKLESPFAALAKLKPRE